MCLLFNEDIIKEVRKMIKGGTITGLAIFQTETGEVVRVVSNISECHSYMISHNVYDENYYASVLINLVDCLSGRIQL